MLAEEWTAEDITELEAFSQQEAWGPREAEYYAALICSVIASVNSTKRTFTPSDFMRNIKTITPKVDTDKLKALTRKHKKK